MSQYLNAPEIIVRDKISKFHFPVSQSYTLFHPIDLVLVNNETFIMKVLLQSFIPQSKYTYFLASTGTLSLRGERQRLLATMQLDFFYYSVAFLCCQGVDSGFAFWIFWFSSAAPMNHASVVPCCLISVLKSVMVNQNGVSPIALFDAQWHLWLNGCFIFWNRAKKQKMKHQWVCNRMPWKIYHPTLAFLTSANMFNKV